MDVTGRAHPAQLQCKLLSGAPALVAQLLLAVIAFASLVYKRHREKPQRPYKIWLMDVSKQICSLGAAHLCGLTIALVVSTRSGRTISECAWYFVAFCFDTTLGVSLAVLLHRWFIRLAGALVRPPDPESARVPSGWAYSISHCGDYGEPAAWGRWAPQMIEWLVATVAARFVCGIVVIGAKVVLQHIARLLDKAVGARPTLELFIVVICGPLLMNMIQAWVQDAVLKRKQGGADGSAAQQQWDESTPLQCKVPVVATAIGRPQGLHARIDASQSDGANVVAQGVAPTQQSTSALWKAGNIKRDFLSFPVEAARLKAN